MKNPEKHGMRHTPEYRAWVDIRLRCTKDNRPDYKDYGGRGITVCEEYFNSFLAFYRDVGPRPSSKHSIDRIDNNGNYEPGNLKWSTREEQMRNNRIYKTNTSGTTGVYHTKDGYWLASIYRKGKLRYLGIFKDKGLAVKARKEAELKWV